MIGPFRSVMLRTLLRPIVVALQLFAVYVVLHGHYSPGGGFQGGVLIGVSLILPLLIEGRQPGLPILQPRTAVPIAAFGVAIFMSVGLASMFFGGAILDYSAMGLPGLDAAARRSLGILVIEIGVTLGVAGAIVSIFYTLHSPGESEEGA